MAVQAATDGGPGGSGDGIGGLSDGGLSCVLTCLTSDGGPGGIGGGWSKPRWLC